MPLHFFATCCFFPVQSLVQTTLVFITKRYAAGCS